MSLSGRLFAAIYDPLMSGTESAGLRARREQLLAHAKGDVLEVGGGTGANLSAYGAGAVDLTVTEPESHMLPRLQRKLQSSGVTAKVLRAPAEDLPFVDASFDVVVSTLVLCTVDDQPRAVRELRRVLRPGGRLLFIEHVRAEQAGLARWQDRLNGLNRILGHGCNCNRPTLDTLQANGFAVTDVSHDSLPKAPPWIRPLVIGSAEPIQR
jgi:ubiquinone/menaquinone biosynthesis C-methylase UbiE